MHFSFSLNFIFVRAIHVNTYNNSALFCCSILFHCMNMYHALFTLSSLLYIKVISSLSIKEQDSTEKIQMSNCFHFQ